MHDALVFWLAYIPRGLLEPICNMLVVLTWPLTRRARNIASQNIQRVYGLPPHSRQQRLFIKQVLSSQILCAIETVRFLYRPHEVSIDNVSAVQGLLEPCESGLILISGHIGSWELAGHFAAKFTPNKLYVLAKRPKVFQALLERMRQRLNMEVLWTDSPQLLRDMIKVLKRGCGLGFVMDQRPAVRASGVPLDFLGLPANFVTGPATMAIRSKVPVFSLYCVRIGLCQYRLICHKIESTATTEIDLTKDMAQDIEAVVRCYPEQWTWTYKRWKR